jgi:hypothetical protein
MKKLMIATALIAFFSFTAFADVITPFSIPVFRGPMNGLFVLTLKICMAGILALWVLESR